MPDLTNHLIFHSLKTKNVFLHLQRLQFKWFYKYLRNILDSVCKLVKSVILTFHL